MPASGDFISREELLGGLPARRAAMLLFAIEGRTARLVDRSRRAMAPGVTERSAEERERAFLQALAEGRDLPLQPTIQDIERYAPAWAPLVPADPAMRAALAHAIGERYTFTARRVPALREALGLGEEAVEAEHARLYGRPLATVFDDTLPPSERLRWRRAAAARRLESLPPFWTAFALTVTETVGAGILALPIAFAGIGPLPGIALLVVFGLVNIATIAAIVEAITRDGGIRYGSGYFGRLVRSYLGSAGSAVLTPALLVLMLLTLVAYYVGVATTVEDVTGVPATVWAAFVFLAGVAILRRENLNATVASALVVGGVNIALMVTLAALALGHVQSENLRHADVPLLGGRPFDSSVLTLVFGVVLASYFGHTSAGNAAKVVLRRDPGGRALMRGNVAALVVAIGFYCLWIVAVNGAVEPSRMADTTGTALAPLAAEVGPLVHVFGTVFVILAMGMGSVHMALGVSNQVREWLPPGAAARGSARGGARRLLDLAGGRRFWLAMTPVAVTFLVVEWLLATDRASFAAPLSFLGTLTIPLVGGIFPVLMLIASRRKGEYVPASVVHLLGHPVLVALVVAVYLGGLLAHGLVIWEAPVERAAALLVFAVVVVLMIVFVRRGVFEPRASIEVRADEARGDHVEVDVIAGGKRVEGAARLGLAGRAPERAAGGDADRRLADLRSVSVSLPETRATHVKIRLHRVTAEGDSEPLDATVDVRARRADDRRIVLGLGGVATARIDGAECEVRIAFPDGTRTRD
ncbi:MAG TPA: aromatic amino acid transport family protein [Gaiellaceae bacterium]|nr:aromatic amino acid transport family protein [Gaiellaceae bacterium]